MKPEELEHIFEELIAVYENLKAEVIIAEIQDKSDLTSDDFFIANQSTFSRPYRRDIISVDKLLHDEMLTLNLSRNGLYDTLPEGLFHTQRKSKDTGSYTGYRKTLKNEEKDARSFFAPLENEFFHQRLGIEYNERQILDDFYNLNDEFLMNFWNVSPDIPENYTLKLIKLLPYCYKIAGDFELTRLCFEKILDERITFQRKFDTSVENEVDGFNKKSKNQLNLGLNSVLHSDFKEVASPVLEVTIGPISEKNINNYLKKDGVMKFINTFYDYFIPIELKVITKFTVDSDDGFLLAKENSPIMGVSTQL